MKELLTRFGYQIQATDLMGDAASGCYEDGIRPKVIGEVSRDDYLADAKAMITPEQAYRKGRNGALAALGTVAIVSLVVGAGVWAEKTGRIDVVPGGTRADFGMEQGPSIPADVPAQTAPTDMPPIVRFN